MRPGADRDDNDRMSEPTPQAQVDAARAYEALFVPALFEQWPAKLADASRVRSGHRVLDVGCGTGILTREMASRTGPTGHVVAVDPSPGMLTVAAELSPDIEWREGIAESLPFPDQSFEVVVSQFAIMFFADRRRGLAEMLRVLAPNGTLAVAVWDSLESMPAYAAEVALLQRAAGRAAADALRMPFVLGNREELARLFAEAGLAADIGTHAGTARFPSIRIMVEADLRGWLPLMGISLDEELIEHILRDAEQVLGAYATEDGRAVFPLSVHLVTATKH